MQPGSAACVPTRQLVCNGWACTLFQRRGALLPTRTICSGPVSVDLFARLRVTPCKALLLLARPCLHFAGIEYIVCIILHVSKCYQSDDAEVTMPLQSLLLLIKLGNLGVMACGDCQAAQMENKEYDWSLPIRLHIHPHQLYGYRSHWYRFQPDGSGHVF